MVKDMTQRSEPKRTARRLEVEEERKRSRLRFSSFLLFSTSESPLACLVAHFATLFLCMVLEGKVTVGLVSFVSLSLPTVTFPTIQNHTENQEESNSLPKTHTLADSQGSREQERYLYLCSCSTLGNLWLACSGFLSVPVFYLLGLSFSYFSKKEEK